MVDAILGAAIMVAISSGVLLAIKLGDQVVLNSGRYPLNSGEINLIQSARPADSLKAIRQLNEDIKLMPQK